MTLYAIPREYHLHGDNRPYLTDGRMYRVIEHRPGGGFIKDDLGYRLGFLWTDCAHAGHWTRWEENDAD